MKTIKHILTIIFLGGVLAFPTAVFAQGGIVHDPVHMGSNVVSFGKELSEAMTQTQTFLSILTNTEQQLEGIKKLNEAVDKVSERVQQMQEVKNCISNAAYTIKYISSSIQMLSSGYLQPYEIKSMLSMYTNCLRRVNYTILDVKDLITDFSSKQTENERAGNIRRSKEELEALQKQMEIGIGKMGGVIWERKRADQAIKSGNIDDIYSSVIEKLPAMALPADPDGKLNLQSHMDISQSLSTTWDIDEETFKPDIKTKVSATTVKRAYNKITSPATRMFYAISALVGMIGIVRCYTKWQMGEDLLKPAFVWLGTSLLLFFVGYLVPMFFS